MSKFQIFVGALLTIICLSVVVGVGRYVFSEKVPSREEQLKAACESHPADCALMRQANASIEATVNSASRVMTPGVMASIDNLYKLKRKMEDRFIETGHYGD